MSQIQVKTVKRYATGETYILVDDVITLLLELAVGEPVDTAIRIEKLAKSIEMLNGEEKMEIPIDIQAQMQRGVGLPQ